MNDRSERRDRWPGAAVAYALGVGALVLTLVLLDALASLGKPASAQLNGSRQLLVRGASSNRGASQGWETVFTETFEAGIGSDWIVTDTSLVDGVTYVWGTSPFTSVSGDHSAWCAGSEDEAGTLYEDHMDAWLVSPPIDLGGFDSDIWDAEVRFAWWLDTGSGVEGGSEGLGAQPVQLVGSPPPSGDWLGWGVLTDLAHLDGAQWTYVSGATGGWAGGLVPLDAFLPVNGALTSTVRIAFRFVSDDDGTVGRGAFVDDVVLRVNHGHEVVLPLVGRDPPPTPTPTPSPTPSPSSLLQNGSFEAGWYDISIGQVPNGWEWHWVEGEEAFEGVYPVAPETRVLPRDQLPPEERDLYVLDGSYCVKVFKAEAPIYAALSQDISGLEVGREYRLRVPVYVDVFEWEDAKEPPDDPSAAQVRLGVSPMGAAWRDEDAISYSGWWDGLNTEHFYLSYNDYHFEFTATESEMTIYVEMFAKWGLDNNGFFLDDVELFLLP